MRVQVQHLMKGGQKESASLAFNEGVDKKIVQV